jgi:hypothetical protein
MISKPEILSGLFSSYGINIADATVKQFRRAFSFVGGVAF